MKTFQKKILVFVTMGMARIVNNMSVERHILGEQGQPSFLKEEKSVCLPQQCDPVEEECKNHEMEKSTREYWKVPYQHQRLVENWSNFHVSENNVALEEKYISLHKQYSDLKEKIKSLENLDYQHINYHQQLERKFKEIVIDSALGDQRVKECLFATAENHEDSDDLVMNSWKRYLADEVRNGMGYTSRHIWKLMGNILPSYILYGRWKQAHEDSMRSPEKIRKILFEHLEYLNQMILDLNYCKEKETELQILLEDPDIRKQYIDYRNPQTFWNDSWKISAPKHDNPELQKRFESLRDQEQVYHFMLDHKQKMQGEVRRSLLGEPCQLLTHQYLAYIQEYPRRFVDLGFNIIPLSNTQKELLSEIDSKDRWRHDAAGLNALAYYKRFLPDMIIDQFRVEHILNRNKAIVEDGKVLDIDSRNELYNYGMLPIVPRDPKNHRFSLREIEENNKVDFTIRELFPLMESLQKMFKKLRSIPFFLDKLERQIYQVALKDAETWFISQSKIDLGRKAVSLSQKDEFLHNEIHCGPLGSVELEILGTTFTDQVWNKLTEPEKVLFALQNMHNSLKGSKQLRYRLQEEVLSLEERWMAAKLLENAQYSNEQEWVLEVLLKAEANDIPLSDSQKQLKKVLQAKSSESPMTQSEFEALLGEFESMVSRKVEFEEGHMEDLIKLISTIHIGLSKFQNTLLIFEMTKSEINTLMECCSRITTGNIPDLDSFISKIEKIVGDARLRQKLSLEPSCFRILEKHHDQAMEDLPFWKSRVGIMHRASRKRYLLVHKYLKKLGIHQEIVNIPMFSTVIPMQRDIEREVFTF